MAEIKTQIRRVLRAGTFQYFVEDGVIDVGFASTNGSGLLKIALEDFDELVKFVNEQREAKDVS